jgi:serine/threonine protein kinase
MAKCPSCSQVIPDEKQACPSCGTALVDSTTPTRLLAVELPASSAPFKDAAGGRRASTDASRSPLSHDSIDNARFIAGTILAERYRIVGLLGRGGMGEVYRADDLKLGQAVALKFLPEHLWSDGAALARFHREVRVARHVSHRNVCRVYDIGEVRGQHFLSMEFIKGEELSSLLRRIGRLPADKATEIARQLCAGLAAAHDNNVLHRDLKPANVMIDADGNVRILDFGLAGLVEEFRDEEMRAGTPAYMSPEQLAGEELTVRSDIYSLGLVLYEVYTGRRAFEAGSLADLLKLRQSETTPTSPSSLVKEIDPLVERVILRCLEKEPKDRPSSALQVAASLPGGDPLQAALAAGETPSPEMVAAAHKEGSLRPAVAFGLLSAFIFLLALSVWLAGKVMPYARIPLEKSPDVLQERAREISKRAGYADQPTDSDYGFITKYSYFSYVEENDKSPSRWDRLKTTQPPVLCFWYRQSPRYLEPFSLTRVTQDDPPVVISGMTGALLDTQGRLISFYRVPPQKEGAKAEAVEPTEADWAILFNEAGLNLQNFKPVESEWVPLYAYDARAAWEGVYPEQPQIPVRVEAASYQGRPVYFEVLNPWEKPARQEQPQLSMSNRVLFALLIGIFLSILLGAVALAVRHIHLGRGDRKGAFRLALVVFFVSLLRGLFSHHVPTFGEWGILWQSVQTALLVACIFWLLYIALEPFVRRRWPEKIISWTRLLAGDFSDPLIGRDILIGAVLGISIIPVQFIMRSVPEWLGWPSTAIAFEPANEQLGLRYAVDALPSQIQGGLLFGFGLLFLLLLLTIMLRKERLAVGATWLICAVPLYFAASDQPLRLLIAPLGAALILLPLVRYGLLAMISAQFFHHLWIFYPMTFNLSAWYAGSFIVGLAASLALVIYAFYISLAGQPLLRGTFLEDERD